jgi:methionyl-tRNA formyltransferase
MGIDPVVKPRILFFGTPDFAVCCLQELLANDDSVVGVVTSPDRPSGRGKKLKGSAVKEFAISKGLNVLQPTNLKAESFIQALKALDADVAVVVAFRMLPKAVWSLPKWGTFNLHASLLPQYRGAAPINWALVNGETESGVTTFFIDEKIDTGAILLQEKIQLNANETAGSLHDRLASLGSRLIVETIIGLQKGNLMPQAQENPPKLLAAPKLSKENTRIPWHKPLLAIQNFVRGMNPYPGAWCILSTEEGEKSVMKLFEVEIYYTEHSYPNGSLVVEDKKIRIAHPQGWVDCTLLQLPNKRRMRASDLLNGYRFHKKSHIN